MHPTDRPAPLAEACRIFPERILSRALTFALTLALACLAEVYDAGAQSQTHALEGGSIESFFKSQPPLKASEIPVAMQILRMASQNASDDAIDRYAASQGVSKDRLDFVVTKVSAAVILITRPGDADAAASAAGTRAALPTPEELELVRPSYPELKKLFPGLE
jgi:hypothetical protein